MKRDLQRSDRKEMSLNLLVSTFLFLEIFIIPTNGKRFKGHGQQQVGDLMVYFKSYQVPLGKFSSRRHLRVFSATLTRDNTQTSGCLLSIYRKAYFDEGRRRLFDLFSMKENSSHPPGRAYCCVRTDDCVQQQLAPVCASGSNPQYLLILF